MRWWLFPLGLSLNSLAKVLITHSWSIKSGNFSNIYIANHILSAYTKCQEHRLAHKMFDEMAQRDSVSWNTMVAGDVNLGNFENAWEFFKNMRKCGFELDGYTFGSLLKGIACAHQWHFGQQVHSMMIKMGYAENVYCGSALLDMYAKCGRVDDASLVFEHMPERNSVSWNALISGYVQMGDRITVFLLFSCMEQEGLKIDDGTVAPLLTLLDDFEFHKSTMQVHGKAIKHGLEFENKVCNATITSYSECGSIADAKKVFDGSFGTRDLVTWNSMLGSYLVHNKEECAFIIFIDMQRFGFEPDIYSYTSIISACFEEAHEKHGKSVHGLIIKRGLEQSVPVSNALIAMYLKNNRSMVEAQCIFESMEVKDRVSWNSILTGLSQIGLSEDALKFFKHMRFEILEIDDYSFSAVLRSCADLATLQLGQQAHVLALKSGLESNEFVVSSLIFMYAKCGIIEDARKSFEENPKDSSITWSSIIFAYAQHGQGHIALDLFSQMKMRKGVKPDYITFVAVLTACSHVGLVEEGCKLLQSMESKYGILPRVEHYACAVDMYGRAGRLDEAKALVESMPIEPDAMVWKTLLGACRSCGNIELASQVAAHLLDVEPEEHCTYVLLSDLYGHLRHWDERAGVKKLMRQRGVKKVPGWSWIEIKNQVHAFKAEDRLHPDCDDIYFVLGVFMDEIRRLDDVDDLEVLMC